MSLELAVARAALTRPPRHRYGDDPSQVADLHVPRGPGPHPVVVVLHGGYWQTTWGKLPTRPISRDLARRGFAAWNLEYRRIGRGRGGGGGWPMTLADVEHGMAALRALDDPRLDLSDVGLVGHSAGGQLALYAAAVATGRSPGVTDAEPLRVGRVVALAPVTDLAAAGAPARTLLGGSHEEVPERFALADPIRLAPVGVPVLVVHPRDDQTVPVRRSRAFAARDDAVTLLETDGTHRTPIDPGGAAWHAAADWLQRAYSARRS